MKKRNTQHKFLPHKGHTQVGMHGDAFSRKATKECSKKFAATFKGKFLTRGHVLRILFLFLGDFGELTLPDLAITPKVRTVHYPAWLSSEVCYLESPEIELGALAAAIHGPTNAKEILACIAGEQPRPGAL